MMSKLNQFFFLIQLTTLISSDKTHHLSHDTKQTEEWYSLQVAGSGTMNLARKMIVIALVE